MINLTIAVFQILTHNRKANLDKMVSYPLKLLFYSDYKFDGMNTYLDEFM